MFITDNCPIITSIPFFKYKNQNFNKFNYVDYNLVKSKLKNETWTSVNEQNIDTVVKNFYNIIINTVNSCTDKKYISAKNKRIKDWITAGLLRSIRIKK